MQLQGENEVYRFALTDGRCIICRDDGSPYDNRLAIHLVDAEGAVVDLIEAGAAMADGIFKVVAKRADGIDFSFFANDRTYRLTWSDEPGWAAPFSMPTGFSYKHRLARHYLTIRQVQTGESG